MKKVILTVVAVLAMATGAIAENRNVSAGYLGGVKDGRLVLGTGVLFHNVGGDFWGGSNRYGADFKVAVPLNDKFSVVGAVGVAVNAGDLTPAGGGELTYKIPTTSTQAVVIGVGYHSAMGVSSSVGYSFN